VILNPATEMAHPSVDNDYLVAQMCWYARANQDLALAPFNPKMWERAKLGDINSNYGVYVWKERQIDVCFQRLAVDQHCRNAVILFNRPSVNLSTTRDPICTTSLQFLIRQNRLWCIATMRSCDWFNGFRNDTFFFMTLQHLLLAKLKKAWPAVKLGEFVLHAASLHMYVRNLSAICIAPTTNSIWPAIFNDIVESDYDYWLNADHQSAGSSPVGKFSQFFVYNYQRLLMMRA